MLHTSWIYPNEPSLAEILSDPVAEALMAADAVDREALDALLRTVARRVEPSLPSSHAIAARAMEARAIKAEARC